ncbi:MAG: DNA primase catalytic subunit PriS [Candidatus Heimdallarchaeum aukensis]|uniref:DNA primase n=1 Tax=Candidatus Heimdallarchaeum aukensis TaxID=2876573 RepID=A0A9Y1FML1_9ARCH|nr:MAG: DNA primase catalytic subunit PriS [Candidatus Heimdallarchaeum aukensis]
MKQVLTKKHISEYYENHFDIDSIMPYIGLSDFRNREFGFVIEESNRERFIRNISFGTSTTLKEYMVSNNVKHAYIGAVYDKPPSNRNPIGKIKWVRRELIFDLDIDEYDEVRTCGCKGDEYCIDCWSLIQDAVIFIEKTMREDFGMQQIKWIYSGRRGVHGWILDRETQFYDQQVRIAILNYLTFVQGKSSGEKVDRIDTLPTEAKPLRNRIYSLIGRSYLSHVSPEELYEISKETDAKMTKKSLETIIKRVKMSKEFDFNSYSRIMPPNNNFRERLSQEMIYRRFPRIDRKVTMDTRRVSRMPYSIHGKTGKIAVEIDDILKFDPFNSPSVWEYVK